MSIKVGRTEAEVSIPSLNDGSSPAGEGNVDGATEGVAE